MCIRDRFTARNVDLKRKVKFKPHKCHKTQISNRTVFINRTYQDFQTLHLESFTEMDTVHSSRDSKKTLLTFFFTKEKLFLTFLMNRCTEGAVPVSYTHLDVYKRQISSCRFQILQRKLLKQELFLLLPSNKKNEASS